MNDKEEKELATTEFYVRVGNSGCFKRTDLPAKALQEIEKLRIALEELEKDFLLEQLQGLGRSNNFMEYMEALHDNMKIILRRKP